MSISLTRQVILRLKRRSIFFAKQVYNTDEFYKFQREARYAVSPPLAFVVPDQVQVVNQEYRGNNKPYRHDEEHTFFVYVRIQTVNDDVNQQAVIDIETDLDDEIRGLLYGWQPAKGFTSIDYLGRSIADTSAEYLDIRYEFSSTVRGIRAKCFDEQEAMEDAGLLHLQGKPKASVNINCGIETDLNYVGCEECPDASND